MHRFRLHRKRWLSDVDVAKSHTMACRNDGIILTLFNFDQTSLLRLKTRTHTARTIDKRFPLALPVRTCITIVVSFVDQAFCPGSLWSIDRPRCWITLSCLTNSNPTALNAIVSGQTLQRLSSQPPMEFGQDMRRSSQRELPNIVRKSHFYREIRLERSFVPFLMKPRPFNVAVGRKVARHRIRRRRR